MGYLNGPGYRGGAVPTKDRTLAGGASQSVSDLGHPMAVTIPNRILEQT